MFNTKAFVQEIKSRNGWKIEDLARITGKSPQTVKRWTTGKGDMGLIDYFQILKASNERNLKSLIEKHSGLDLACEEKALYHSKENDLETEIRILKDKIIDLQDKLINR